MMQDVHGVSVATPTERDPDDRTLVLVKLTEAGVRLHLGHVSILLTPEEAERIADNLQDAAKRVAAVKEN